MILALGPLVDGVVKFLRDLPAKKNNSSEIIFFASNIIERHEL